MKYQPVSCVWEITMGCNMRCGHCGSSCTDPLPDELTTEQALTLIDQFGDIGLKHITLSGGEPLTRKDLPELIKRLIKNSIAPNIITNGWLIDDNIVNSLKESGIKTVAVSIDGTRGIHDKIRKEGSFEKCMSAYSCLKKARMITGAITTVSKLNIGNLPAIREMLIENGINSWQLQIGLPMGNFSSQPDWVIEPAQIDEILDFCFETSQQGRIVVYPADCLGYYTEKESMIKRKAFNTNGYPLWDGCAAGIRSFGVLHNGDILGCASVRSPEFIEGNILKQSLKEIWNAPGKFSWRRDMTKSKLKGDCVICNYGSKCLGGCPNTRLTMGGDIYSENTYCSYNHSLKKFKAGLAARNDAKDMMANAELMVRDGKNQDVAMLTNRIIEIEPDNFEALRLNGYAQFMCGNYKLCEEANRKALSLFPHDAYSVKGLGMSLHKQGNSKEALELLEKAAKMTNFLDRDILYDLQVVKRESMLNNA